MGYNSTIVVLNDALSTIRKHPEQFVEKMSSGISEMSLPKEHRRNDQAVGNHGNPFSVVACQHADVTQLLAVGGNYGSVIGLHSNGGRHETDDDMVGILRIAAEKYGYELHKIPQNRRRS